MLRRSQRVERASLLALAGRPGRALSLTSDADGNAHRQGAEADQPGGRGSTPPRDASGATPGDEAEHLHARHQRPARAALRRGRRRRSREAGRRRSGRAPRGWPSAMTAPTATETPSAVRRRPGRRPTEARRRSSTTRRGSRCARAEVQRQVGARSAGGHPAAASSVASSGLVEPRLVHGPLAPPRGPAPRRARCPAACAWPRARGCGCPPRRRAGTRPSASP